MPIKAMKSMKRDAAWEAERARKAARQSVLSEYSSQKKEVQALMSSKPETIAILRKHAQNLGYLNPLGEVTAPKDPTPQKALPAPLGAETRLPINEGDAADSIFGSEGEVKPKDVTPNSKAMKADTVVIFAKVLSLEFPKDCKYLMHVDMPGQCLTVAQLAYLLANINKNVFSLAAPHPARSEIQTPFLLLFAFIVQAEFPNLGLKFKSRLILVFKRLIVYCPMFCS